MGRGEGDKYIVLIISVYIYFVYLAIELKTAGGKYSYDSKHYVVRVTYMIDLHRQTANLKLLVMKYVRFSIVCYVTPNYSALTNRALTAFKSCSQRRIGIL